MSWELRYIKGQSLKSSYTQIHVVIKCDRPHRRLPIATHLRASRDLRVARSAHKNIDIKNKEIGELKIFKTKDPSCKANNINTVQCQEYCQHRPPSVNKPHTQVLIRPWVRGWQCVTLPKYFHGI